jgi:hypothetical protein
VSDLIVYGHSTDEEEGASSCSKDARRRFSRHASCAHSAMRYSLCLILSIVMSTPAPYQKSGVGPPQPPPQRGATGPPRQVTGMPAPNGSSRSVSRTPGNESQLVPPPRAKDDNSTTGGASTHASNDKFDEETQEEPKYKYSSQSMQRHPWRKWCCILLGFLICMAIAIGISMLIQHLFFQKNDPEDDTDTPIRNESDTPFIYDKSTVDGQCGRSMFDGNGGMECKELCRPAFFHCCDPFNEYNLYNISNDPNAIAPAGNETDVNGTAYNMSECTFETETRGCIAYSKCQAASGFNDPAPATLPILCTQPRLSEDPDSCMELCNPQNCCYREGRGCASTMFDVCLDYAPCQNLRAGAILQSAPIGLDEDCFNEDDDCAEVCDKAACCNLDAVDSCFQDNVITCLTYAACTESNLTDTNITIPEQFSFAPKPPSDLIFVCNADRDAQSSELAICADYCMQSECCRAVNSADAPDVSCFLKDPLGCMEWNHQCSVLTPPT